jgi:hypothetical protein
MSEIEEDVAVDRLENRLADAQEKDGDLDTSDVQNAVMDALGYDARERHAAYQDEDAAFRTLVKAHGYAAIRVELDAAIEKLGAERLGERLAEAQEKDPAFDGEEVRDLVLHRLSYSFEGRDKAISAEGGVYLALVKEHRYAAVSALLDDAIASLAAKPVLERAYTVEGRWPFPGDMLKRDVARAATPEDQLLIDRMSGEFSDPSLGTRERVKINLVMVAGEATRARPDGPLRPNDERWESFGWVVVGDSEIEGMRAHRRQLKADQAVLAAALAKLTPDELRVLRRLGLPPE